MAELSFKFRFVQNGMAQGLRSKRGAVGDQGLVLGDESLAYGDIQSTATRDNRLVMTLRPGAHIGPQTAAQLVHDEGVVALVLEVYGASALTVERAVDRKVSAVQLARRRDELAREGRLGELRTATCPECQSVNDLSELDEGRYVYCTFCQTIFSRQQGSHTRGDAYAVCEECGMFNRIKGYTEFYFYFLLVVYGVSWKRRHLCDHCAGRLFWKVLLLNLLFVLGVPFAIAMKIKSLTGRDPNLRELTRANALALEGRYREADTIYEKLHAHYADHPGLHLNQGLGHINGGDIEGGVHHLTRSLESCPGYVPAAQVLTGLQALAHEQRAA